MLLQIFSNNGEFRNRFGVRGRLPGQLQRPTGVAVHPSGDIIIADYDNKWVSIFSGEGKFKVGAADWLAGPWGRGSSEVAACDRPSWARAASWGPRACPWTTTVM